MRIFPTRRFDPYQKLPMQGFTIAELLVVSALALLVGGMLLAAFFFGNRMWQITQTKIHATDKTRQVIRLLTSDVHAAKTLRVGNGTLNSFSEAAVDSPQTGNALQVYPTFDTNYFVRYYRDAADKKLKCITNGSGTPVVIAKSVVNPVVFQMEDFAGNVLTGKQNNCVIGLMLDFSEIEEPGVPVGPGAYYQSFRIATKIGKRAL